MELFDAIASRYSYRGEFTDAPIPREDLKKVVQAGIQAPSASNKQVATFVIVDDSSLLRQIADTVDNRPVCRSAKAMIACVVDLHPIFGGTSFTAEECAAFFAEDCAAAVENMLLAITGLGYASVWLDGVLRGENRAERIARLLGIPVGKTVRILLPLGVPVKPGYQKDKLPFDQRAWFNCYGGGD
jgi:nitroreductase